MSATAYRKQHWLLWLQATPNLHASLGRDPEHQQEHALAEILAERGLPPGPQSRAETQATLNRRIVKCDDGCRGWFVDHERFVVVTCDECRTLNHLHLHDEDVARLSVAQRELADVVYKMVAKHKVQVINQHLTRAVANRRVVVHINAENLTITMRGPNKQELQLCDALPLEAVAYLDGMAVALGLVTR